MRSAVHMLLLGALLPSASVFTAAAYIGAVLESSPTQTPVATAEDGFRQMNATWATYEPLVWEAARSGAEILVLNEMAVSGFSFTTAEQVHPFLFQFPKEGSDMCSGVLPSMPSAPILQRMACLAAAANITIVADLPEKRPCASAQQGCPSRGWWQFNTQVSLVGGSGQLGSRYVKNHLYLPGGEGLIFDTAPWAPSYVTFVSHTGRLFGQAVCFDAFFPNPIQTLAAAGVRDIVFSSYWENLGSYPIIAAQPLQRAVSQAGGFNFLAASVGYSWKNSGSGLYSQGSIVNASYSTSASPQTTLLVGELPDLGPPKVSIGSSRALLHHDLGGPSAVGNMTLLRVPVTPDVQRVQHTLQHGHLTCTFDLTLQGLDVSTIGLIAQDGQYMVGAMRSQLCSLQVCPSGQCSLSDLPIPAWRGVRLLKGSMTATGFTARPGFTIASGPFGKPSQPSWETVQASTGGGLYGVRGAGAQWDVTTLTVFGAYASL